MSARRKDLWLAAALLVFAAATWFWLIPVFAGGGDQVMMPRLYIAMIFILAAGMAVSALRHTAAVDDDDPFLELGGGEPAVIVGLVVTWGAFSFLIGWTGFYLGGLVALVLSFLLLGARRPLPILLWSAGTLVAVHVVFEQGFGLVIRASVLERMLLDLAGL